MKRNRCTLLSFLLLVVSILASIPSELRADYAPDGISALWWIAGQTPDEMPDAVIALKQGWQQDQHENRTQWNHILKPSVFVDPVLVIASINASRIEVQLDDQTIYSFGTKKAGFARKQAANAVHWISIPVAQHERTLRIHAYTMQNAVPSTDLPMILYAASTPLLRHLQRAAAGRITLALLFVFVGVYAGLAWLVRRRYGIRFSPWFAALTLSLGLGLLISSVMEFLPPAAAARIYYVGLLLILLFPAALWRFMEESLGAGPGKIIRRCWQLQLLSAVLLWLPDLLGLRAFGTTAQLIGNSILALQLCVGAWVGVRHTRIGDTSQKWVALGIFLLSIAGLVDIADAILVGDPTFELYPLGALALVLVLAYVQERAAGEAQRLLRRQAETLHRQQAHLEEQVETRTAQLRETTKAAQAANQAKSDFLANMSHELRTPLNAILGHAQLLRKDDGVSMQLRERGDIIRQSGEHLLTLINDVLDLARIEAGRLDISTAAVDLSALLAGIVELLKPRAEKKSLSFACEHKTSIPDIIETDERRVRQILINLIGNAIKFTENGSVRLEIAYRNEELLFSVYDTGPGIRNDDITRIFKAFEQGTDAMNQEGTGLGLSISRNLAQRMGGDIGVNSKPGQGSEFWFRMPCHPVAPPHLASPTVAGASPQEDWSGFREENLSSDYKTLIEAAGIGDLATVKNEIPILRKQHPEDSAFLNELERLTTQFDIEKLQQYLSA